jgi:hypothetical protein
VLGLSAADRLAILIGAPAIGLVFGFLLPPASKWISKLPLPLLGPFKLIASFRTGWVVLVCVAFGLLVGLALAASALKESLTVKISDDKIELARDKAVRTIPRSDVDAVFTDGNKLVVLDRESRQLVRDKPEAKPDRLAQAFRVHGYPVVAGDPYAELYQQWQPDTPDLPSTVNSLLAAREVALRRKVTEDAAKLRDEVEKLGFTVRDDATHQFWRPLVRS